MPSRLSRLVRNLVPVAVLGLLVGCGERPPASPTSAAQRYTVSGLVSTPAGDAVAGAAVRAGATSVTTDESGRYAIGELYGGVTVDISKDGYERQLVPVYLDRDRVMNVTLPPVVRIAPGDPATVTLYASEPGYDFSYYDFACVAPCKLVHVTAPEAGTLSITLAPRDPTRRLAAFVLSNGRSTSYDPASTITIPFAFTASGEVIFYVAFVGGPAAAGDPRIDVSPSFRPKN